MAAVRGPPIDRGWAWVVLAACFMNMMFCIGYMRSFGIFFFELLHAYKTSSSVTTLVMGIQGAVFSISGFCAQTILSVYISERTTIMLGGLLVAAGIILSVFANTISLLIVTQSVLVGCGNAFILSPGLVLLSKYFDKHRSFATAIANTGANLGAIVVPILIRYLLDEHGLRGVFLIYGGLVLNIIAFGRLMRPIQSYGCPDDLLTPAGDHKEDNHKLLKPVNSHQKETSLLSMNNENDVKEDNHQPVNTVNSDKKETSLLSMNKNNDNYLYPINEQTPEIKLLIPEEVKNGDAVLRSSSASIHTDRYSNMSAVRFSSTPDLACMSTHDIPTSPEPEPQSAKPRSCLVVWLNKTLDFSLFRKSLFYLLMVIALFGVQGGGVMGIYLPALAKDKNATNYEATAILSASGASGVVSRLGVGFFADRDIMKRHHILSAAMLVTGVIGLLVPFYTSFWSLMLFGLAYGFFGSLYFSLIPVIIVDFLGLNKLAKTFGFLQLVHGAGIATSHPICGYLRDVTGSFEASYQLFGVACIVTAIILLFEPCARRIDERRSDIKHVEND